MLISDRFLILVFVILFLVRISVLIFKNDSKFKWKKELLIQIFIIYVLSLLSVTVFPLELEGSRARTDYGWNYASSVNLVPLINTLNQISAVDNGPFVSFMLRFWAVNILGNLILLFPLGFLAPLVSKKYQKFKNVLLLTFLITLSIELFQILSPLIGIGHRSFDIDDIILNTAGGILGFTAYMKVRCIKFYKFSHINADSVETER